MSAEPEVAELRTDVRGLIRLLAKNLYAQPDVFIREMIQNAQDSVMRRRELMGADAPAGQIQIRIDWSREQPRIVFEDNGAGLTREEIREYLSTIGRSGTEAFRQDLERRGRYAESSSLIGQFGIGLLSAFVVAEEVRVQTRSYLPDSQGWCWVCRGDREYTLAPDESAPVGARVTLMIAGDQRDVLDPGFVRDAVRKYADFIPVPILLNSEGRINAVDAPWHRTYTSEAERDETYRYFVDRRFPDVPLVLIPIEIDEPYPVRGVLYIGTRITDASSVGRVDIYQSRMFIAAGNSELLPNWAKFVSGVIDSPALTPTAARDNVQQDAVFRAIRDLLGGAVIGHLKRLAAANPTRFQEIMDYHHRAIKGMALEDNSFFRDVAELLPFETNERPMALREYLERAVKSADGRRRILYFSERGQATQFFMLANARGILVINASYVYETQFLKKYAQEFQDVRLEQVDFSESDVIFERLEPDEALMFRELVNEFILSVATPGTRATMVRFVPTKIPAVLTLTESQKLRNELNALKSNPAIPQHFRDIMGRVLEDRPSMPVTIHLNANNPTIQALARMNLRTEEATNAMVAIYNNALMLAQHLITPQNAEIMFTQFNRVIDLLIEQTRQASDLRQRVLNLEREAQAQNVSGALSPHVSCFVAFDADKRQPVFEALQQILQDKPYYWEVVRAEGQIEQPDLLPNLTNKMRRAHCFVVEASDANANVLMELGMVVSLGRPTLLLLAADQPAAGLGANLGGKLYESYDFWGDPDQMREQLGTMLLRQSGFEELRRQSHPRFLSPVVLRGAQVGEPLKEQVCREFSTVEAFLAADATALARRLGERTPFLIQALQSYLTDYCGIETGRP